MREIDSKWCWQVIKGIVGLRSMSEIAHDLGEYADRDYFKARQILLLLSLRCNQRSLRAYRIHAIPEHTIDPSSRCAERVGAIPRAVPQTCCLDRQVAPARPVQQSEQLGDARESPRSVRLELRISLFSQLKSSEGPNTIR